MQHFLRKENIQPVVFSCRKLFLNMNKYLLLFCSYSEHQRVVFLVFDILSCFKPNHGWGFTRLGDYKIVVRPSSNDQLLQKAMLCSCLTQLIHYGSYYHKGIKCSFFLYCCKIQSGFESTRKVKKTSAITFQSDHKCLDFFLCRKCEMDEASEDSRPAQPGFVKKFFITISQVIFQNCQFLLLSADTDFKSRQVF